MTEELFLALILFAAGGWGIVWLVVSFIRACFPKRRGAVWSEPVKDSRSSIEQFNRIMGR